LQTGEVLVRKLLAGEKPNHYSLVPINEKHKKDIIKNIQVFSAAYIIWTRKKDLT
jgi:hypothetical protein